MNELAVQIEALLFVRTKPVSVSSLARAFDVKKETVEEALGELVRVRNVEHSGIHVLQSDEGVSLATNPSVAGAIAHQTREEQQAELTRPQLETLTIIAYRGPVTKAEIEHIRGVNCSLIIRNLLVRGLIDERDDEVKLLPVYSLTTDMLRHLGIHTVQELPDYEELHKHARIDQMLATFATEENEISN